MKRYIVRHGHTGVSRDQRNTFGYEGPPISVQGKNEAKKLGLRLVKLGIDVYSEAVAVSEYLRTRQTAELAGFQIVNKNALINEIFTGIPNNELKAMIQRRKLPTIVLQKAQAVLDNPPMETVWVTHGLVIMGLRELLGIAAEPFDPPHCEIIELNI